MVTNSILLCLFIAVTADEVTPQHTENSVNNAVTSNLPPGQNTSNPVTNESTSNPQLNSTTTAILQETHVIEEPSIFIKLYNNLTMAVRSFIQSPRVIAVFRNVGTCVVNGVLEIVTYYLPAPMIPLVASAAGLVIPFEPVVTLREKMPVTSYRRAFDKAYNSFMGSFNKYKNIDFEDPYMTRRFNRRLMNDSPEKIPKKHSEE